MGKVGQERDVPEVEEIQAAGCQCFPGHKGLQSQFYIINGNITV